MEWRDGAENSKLRIMVFLVPVQKPIRIPLRVTSLEQKTLLSPRKFQGPCLRNWGQRPNIRTKMLPVLLLVRKSQGLGVCVRNWGQRPTYVFSIITRHHTPMRRPGSRRLTPNAGEDVEQQGPSIIAGGNAKWHSPFEDSLAWCMLPLVRSFLCVFLRCPLVFRVQVFYLLA